MLKTKQKGFTIVELLIVIVVIGILAAITIVAYNGIQQRAQNTQRISVAKDWQKIITAHVALTNTYPINIPANHLCLGSGYETNWDASSDEDCGWSNNVKHPTPTVNSAYATIGSLPSWPQARQQLSTTVFVGGIGIRAVEALDPNGSNKLNYPTLLYWLNGNNQDCVLRPVTTAVTGGITLSNTAINSGNDGFLTFCRIALPDPASL